MIIFLIFKFNSCLIYYLEQKDPINVISTPADIEEIAESDNATSHTQPNIDVVAEDTLNSEVVSFLKFHS